MVLVKGASAGAKEAVSESDGRPPDAGSLIEDAN
jgi:hypothetical protein